MTTPVLAFTGLLSIAAGILFGIAPAFHVVRTTRSISRDHGSLRAVLLTAQVGFSLALLIATGLLVRSYVRLRSEDPGFSSDKLMTATIALPPTKYISPSKRVEFFRRLVADAAGMPGVSTAAAVRFLPLSGVASVWAVSIPDRPSESFPGAFHYIVTPGYFRAMRIPLLAGRTFDGNDSSSRPRVALLSKTAAKRYFPNDLDPIGRYIRIQDEQRANWRVIGIVGDVRSLRPDLPPRPQIYVPVDQSPVSTMSLVIRTERDPSTHARPIRALVQRIDKDQAIADVKTMAEVVADATARWRVSTSLFLCFGATSLILALIGLFSVVSYNVAQRTREIAIRVALGSSYRGIIWMVLQSVVVICGIGIMLGLLLAIAAKHSLRSLLYGIDPLDAGTFIAAAITFLIVALMVATAAACNATRIDPAVALKQEC